MEMLQPRHEGHHHYTGNVKYGYIVLGLSVLYIAYRQLSLWWYRRSWRTSGRSTTHLGVVSIPVGYLAAIMFGLTAIVALFGMDLDAYKLTIKRFGRVAYSLSPLCIFLSLRPCPFELDNYLSALSVHLWVGRLAVLYASVHSVGYLVVWAAEGTMGETLRPLNFVGLPLFALLAVLGVVGWQPIRGLLYRWFYLLHNIAVYAFVFGTAVHARPGVSVTFWINIALLVYQAVLRFRSLTSTTITDVVRTEGSDLQVVKLPLSSVPTSHVRLSVPFTSPGFWAWPSHPYTVAVSGTRGTRGTHGSAGSEGIGLQALFVIKATKFQLIPHATYSLQPHFESGVWEEFYATAENVAVVCGGAGISYGVGVWDRLRQRGVEVLLVWYTRHTADLFVLEELGLSGEKGIDVYITRDGAAGEGIELADLEQNAIMPDPTGAADPRTETDDPRSGTPATHVHQGRTPIPTAVASHLNKTIDYANKWVVGCGPAGLVEECTRVAETRGCRSLAEAYVI